MIAYLVSHRDVVVPLLLLAAGLAAGVMVGLMYQVRSSYRAGLAAGPAQAEEERTRRAERIRRYQASRRSAEPTLVLPQSELPEVLRFPAQRGYRKAGRP